MSNPKTTILGVLAIIGAVAGAASALLSGHPVDWTATASAVMAGIGLITAADSKP